MTGNGKVQLAYLHNEHVSHSWFDSMRRAYMHDRASGANILVEKPLNLRATSGMLAHVRNFGVALFLDRTEHEWLMMVDTDMGFEDDAIHRLVAAADPEARPFVGGLCFALMEARYDGMGGHRFTLVPTMYKLGTVESTGSKSFCYYGPYEPNTLTPVAGTGGAFILMHRSMLEAMRAKWGDHWFDQLYSDAGSFVGEDLALCLRALVLGVTPHVHTGIQTTHHKELWLSEQDYVGQNILAEATDSPEVPEPFGDPLFIDIGASLATLAANEHVQDGMFKLLPDLERYRRVIESTKPDLIIETGTHTGNSARWFAALGPNVISIDIDHTHLNRDPLNGLNEEIQFIKADSIDVELFRRIEASVNDRDANLGDLRVMVVLDSNHSAKHVAREIELWGSLVTPGCYLVVEDTLFAWAPQILRQVHFPDGLVGSPLDAVATHLHDNPEWSRDVDIERMSPTSHHPAGWWVRND